MFGPCSVRVCSGLLHRGSLLLHFANQYDYSPYRLELGPDAEADLARASTQEELDLLTQGIPLRVYQVTAINPSVSLVLADHPGTFQLFNSYLPAN